MLVRLRSCDNIIAMEALSDQEEVYFQEEEPEVPIDTPHEDEDDRPNYNSCIIRRDNLQTAPLNFRPAKLNCLDRQGVGGTAGEGGRKKQRLEHSASPSKHYEYRSTKKSGGVGSYRTIYSTKKQSSPLPLVSYSPENLTKAHRKSESPNRKSQYWQSWLLEPKLATHNHSAIIPKTLKVERQPMPRVSASSFVAMMGDDMEVLGGKGEDERREIASLTKIMTAYTVICICNSYGIKVREHKLTILQQASFIEGTSANLRPDEQLSVMDLLYGLLLPSGNDAGVALAQYFGKFLSFKFAKDNREEEWLEKFKSLKEFYDCNYQRESIKLFVFEMNKHSHSIGLRNTHFANPTGLSNSKNYSSARDIALLTAHCLRNHLMREIFRKKVYVCTATNERLSYAREVQWKNTNKHLYQFRECIGVKTGITPTAGPCLSSAYRIMNRELVVVVLNCGSIDQRYEDAKAIYKWCRANMRVR